MFQTALIVMLDTMDHTEEALAWPAVPDITKTLQASKAAGVQLTVLLVLATPVPVLQLVLTPSQTAWSALPWQALQTALFVMLGTEALAARSARRDNTKRPLARKSA